MSPLKKISSVVLVFALVLESVPFIPAGEAQARSGPERIDRKYKDASSWFTAQDSARRSGNSEEAVNHQKDIWSLINTQFGNFPVRSDEEQKSTLTDEEKAKVKEILGISPAYSKLRPMEDVIHIPEESWYYVDYFDEDGNLIGTKKVFSEMIGDKVTDIWTDKDGVVKKREEKNAVETVILPSVESPSPRATPYEAEHSAELTDQEKEEVLKILGATPAFKTELQGFEDYQAFYFDANGNLIGSR